ncbi:MAG: exosome complex protein Rrp42 [Candidatus Diapherotrites archaeon]|nr:exosome complex protein Rrp42 [Candidatus Diapherotrites archaeon]
MSKTNLYWVIKKDSLLADLSHGKRSDKRKFDEYRKITVEKGVSDTAEGSAMVQMGKTKVIAGVKISVGTPYPDSPDKGTMMVNAELLPLSSPDFEPGFPSEDAVELSRVVDRGIRESHAIDLEKLCIREGELVYSVFVDIDIINYDGNLFDACELAGIAALEDTKLPKVKDEKIVEGEFTGKLPINHQPIECTFAKIGEHILLDPDLEEDNCKEAAFTIAITEKDVICAMQKRGSKPFTKDELTSMIDTAIKESKKLRSNL